MGRPWPRVCVCVCAVSAFCLAPIRPRRSQGPLPAWQGAREGSESKQNNNNQATKGRQDVTSQPVQIVFGFAISATPFVWYTSWQTPHPTDNAFTVAYPLLGALDAPESKTNKDATRHNGSLMDLGPQHALPWAFQNRPVYTIR